MKMIYITLCFLQLVCSIKFLLETEDSNKAQKSPRWTGLKHHAKYETGFESKEEDGVAEKDKAAANTAGKEAKDYQAGIFNGIRINERRRECPGNGGWDHEAGKCRKRVHHNYRTTTKKSGSCFGPTNTVETKEGMKTIPELHIGDLIRTSTGYHHTDFTEFFGWMDRQKSSPAEMLQIFTSDNSVAVTLSGSHLVFTTNTTKYAGDLVPGDTLLHWDGEQVEEQEISMIKTSMESGYWAPLTRSGTLLVNDYLMSCYASYPHTVSDIAMGPVKAIPTILLDDEESQHNDGVRQTIRLMKGIGRFVGTRREERKDGNSHINVARFSDLMKTEL